MKRSATLLGLLGFLCVIQASHAFGDANFQNNDRPPVGDIALAGARIRSVTIQTFAASATYTPNAHLVYAIVKMVGGGAGGNSGGGGGGEYAEGVFSAATIGLGQSVIVGFGGSAGSNGGVTSFGSLMTALGGSPATNCVANINSNMCQGGLGGRGGTGGFFHSPGGAGGFSFDAAYNFQLYVGGNGGNSMFGSGGVGGIGVGTGYTPTSGTGYGAGGGGAVSYGSNQSGTGGLVQVIEYNSQ